MSSLYLALLLILLGGVCHLLKRVCIRLERACRLLREIRNALVFEDEDDGDGEEVPVPDVLPLHATRGGIWNRRVSNG